jgi:hypothetical protein
MVLGSTKVLEDVSEVDEVTSRLNPFVSALWFKIYAIP